MRTYAETVGILATKVYNLAAIGDRHPLHTLYQVIDGACIALGDAPEYPIDKVCTDIYNKAKELAVWRNDTTVQHTLNNLDSRGM